MISTLPASFHRQHPFTLPAPGDLIVSPITAETTLREFGADFIPRADVFACVDEWDHDLVHMLQWHRAG
jgi:hypothetical protein